MMRCFASASFGLSPVVAGELKRLGANNVTTADARVYFDADASFLARANLWLRSADRVYIVVSEFDAPTFDALYEGVRAAHLADYVAKSAAFPVTADSVRSALKSVSDVQAVAKKAAADSLMAAHRVRVLPESGAAVRLHVFLLNDRATLCVNTSGAGLNRRGYRTSNAPAPLRETLAAGLLDVAGYRGGPLIDPMCGGGTIAIEGYLRAKNIAPGLNRSFDLEHLFGHKLVERAKAEAREAVLTDEPEIYASDIDPAVVKLARAHAKKAGAKIDLRVADARREYACDGHIVTNPPYAVRLMEQEEARALYRQLGGFLKTGRATRAFICADQSFERFFGKRVGRKRKLYNGNIMCNLYIYYPDEK